MTFTGRFVRLQKRFLLSLLGKRHFDVSIARRKRKFELFVDDLKNPANGKAESERAEKQVRRQAGGCRNGRKSRRLETDERFFLTLLL